MEIDATTAADLEIFGTGDGGSGLLHFIDTTTTSQGHTALRRRFKRPMSDLGEIRRVQEAVRFLRDHGDRIRLEGPLLESVSRYVESNIQISRAGPVSAIVEEAWLWLRYRGLWRELEAGIRAAVDLFARCTRMCETIRLSEPPTIVADLVAELEDTAETVLRIHGGVRGRLRVDRALRVENAGAISRALGLLGELDALMAMAAATRANGWTIPELVDSDSFVFEADGVYHPFVSEAVTNPARLTGGAPLLFLTGPNMAGKTTYLRSVAIVTLLAQVGMGVPAQRARLSPVDAIFTSLNPVDNLRAGLSYFLVEVMRVKAAATLLAEGRRALVVFDEVFKGTNVRDALDASAQVILGFARSRRSGCIFSSHLAELVDALSENDAITYCYFDGDIVAGVPRYEYRLREGVSDKRLGLHLLEQARVPELLARIA